MKPDGVTMETIEPTEAIVEAEPSLSQAVAMHEEVTQQAPSPSQPEVTANAQEPENSTEPPAPQEANGRPAAAAAVDYKAKPKGISSKVQPGTTAGITKTTGPSKPNSRPGTSTSRTVNGVKPSTNDPTKKTAVKKTTSTTAASTLGAVPKRHQGVAAFSSVRTQTKVADKKPLGPVRTTSAAAAAATVTHGTRPAPVNGARPKFTAPTSKAAASTAPKPSTSTAAKTDRPAVSKTTRPAAGPSTFRPSSSTASSKPSTTGLGTATVKPSTAGLGTSTAALKSSTTTSSSTRPVVSRVTMAPSAGRATAAQAPKNNAAAKKDISRPASAAATKKPTGTTSTATKKTEPSKLAATSRPDPASKRPPPTKAAEPKTSRPKTQESAKHPPAKKATKPITRPPITNRQALGTTPPASPANKPLGSRTPQSAKRPKPTQSVLPFTATKKTQIQNSNSASAAPAAAAASAAVTAMAATLSVAAAAVIAELAEVPAAAQTEAEVAVPEMPSAVTAVPEEVPTVSLAEDTPAEMVPLAALGAAAVFSPPQSPVRAAIFPATPSQDLAESPAPLIVAQEQCSAPVEAVIQTMASSPKQEPPEEPVHLIPDQTSSTSKAPPLEAAVSPPLATSSNLNEEDLEDEEEKEGSQQVSVSDMSGPTEESRPGSAGPAGASAWRAGGALLSELDSEEVSCSQQGASELSAPGVLEGTESMDDLGDGSLKGAIDMEGASAGSPDFERVPDIPANDFEEDEDDDDDEDRVCDMDVGSERAEDPRRARHDNEVEEEEEDEDVEMASEGVTESGLESYGNADEDDFAEDERLDNLNRAAHQPPPPLLPSVPAGQWDQPNPFTDHWAQPLPPPQPQQHLQHQSQSFQPAPASPSTDPWQADSETPTQSPAQAWLELGSAPFVPQNQEASHHLSIQAEPPKPEHQIDMDKSSPAPMQTLSPALLPVPGMSQSSTMSSETSTPEELCDYNREGKLHSQAAQAPVLSLQPDPEDQDLGIHLEQGDGEGDEEAETLPADEVLGGPATAPTSNPSSSSTTEDEASDTEGEAQLEDPMDGRGLDDVALHIQPPTLRSLSVLEEREEAGPEEAEGGAREDTTPLSANSAASYGFDTMTTASNSNAPSTGDSCTKSPGIFSLEELPEEAKEELSQGPQILPSQPGSNPAEQHYMQCGQLAAQLVEDRREGNSSEGALDPPLSTLTSQQRPEDDSTDPQPPYYSAICEKTENSLAGLSALPHPHRRDHPAHPRSHCDIIIPHCDAVTPPRLSCADLPPRSPGLQALSPQLRRLEQHQRQLLELQQRREQQNQPRGEREEEEEEERKKEERRELKEDEEKRVKAEMAIKKNEEEEEKKRKEEAKQREELEKQKRDHLQLQLQQQQQELKQRQQIMQWQQELEEQQCQKGQSTVLLSPSSGLCTIYEALENSDDEGEGPKEPKAEEQENPREERFNKEVDRHLERVMSDEDGDEITPTSTQSPPPLPDSPQRPADPQHPDVSNPPQDDRSSPVPTDSPERPPPLDLDWGKKVDIVQQLINQTLLLTGDGCSSLLLLPGGGGGTLSPLESSLWPSLLPPLTPPSATVTSVSSFSPEAPGSSPQGEWTVVELETHH